MTWVMELIEKVKSLTNTYFKEDIPGPGNPGPQGISPSLANNNCESS